MKLASPKLDTSHLSREEQALSRCEIALDQKDKANIEGALEIMFPLWQGVGSRPDTQGLNRRRLPMSLFALGFSPAGLVLAFKSRMHKRARGT